MGRVLIACEFSGRVRDAFTAAGHDAVSCDYLPSETPGQHYQGNVLDIISEQWDLLIAHPPCQHLAVSGARWFKEKATEQAEALAFVRTLLDAPIPRIALENPVSIISSQIRKPTQIIHPWQFGHGEVKTTCLWLKNLPPLTPTNIVEGRHPAILLTPERKSRRQDRSRTYEGIAQAMAQQWGELLPKTHKKERTPTEYSYRQEFARCGKERCKKCRDGQGHGPYWYAYYSEGGRTRKKYIGKELPKLPGDDQQPDPRHPAVKRFLKETGKL